MIDYEQESLRMKQALLDSMSLVYSGDGVAIGKIIEQYQERLSRFRDNSRRDSEGQTGDPEPTYTEHSTSP